MSRRPPVFATSVIEQGCACLSPGSAIWRHKFARHTGRTSSSIRSDLDFRYTQGSKPKSKARPTDTESRPRRQARRQEIRNKRPASAGHFILELPSRSKLLPFLSTPRAPVEVSKVHGSTEGSKARNSGMVML